MSNNTSNIWHPLTQHKTYADPLEISKAQGIFLYDANGNAYIDGISSWYTCTYGHCNPYIIDKVKQQLDTLDQVVFTGFTHQPAIQLSKKLMEILPTAQSKIFFSDNGSTSVDIALKMAFQYYYNKGDKRTKVIALEEGFHGDTFGAMSVSDLSVYNGPFETFFLDVIRIPVPTAETIDAVEQQLSTIIKENDIASFIYEPLVQGAAAMKIHDGVMMDRLLKICKTNNVLTIADEVMTGFGKTGTYFASDQINTKPDIMCMAKSLTAGIAPMALTSCSQEVFDAFYDESILKGFFHGHTYSANPLACTAALAGIELLTSEKIQEQIQMIEQENETFAQSIKDLDIVKTVKSKGVILSIELDIDADRYGDLRNKLYTFYMNNGVYLRPLGKVIYTLPPFIITKEELHSIFDVILASFKEI